MELQQFGQRHNEILLFRRDLEIKDQMVNQIVSRMRSPAINSEPQLRSARDHNRFGSQQWRPRDSSNIWGKILQTAATNDTTVKIHNSELGGERMLAKYRKLLLWKELLTQGSKHSTK